VKAEVQRCCRAPENRLGIIQSLMAQRLITFPPSRTFLCAGPPMIYSISLSPLSRKTAPTPPQYQGSCETQRRTVRELEGGTPSWSVLPA